MTIDPETADEACALISTAIAELLEGAHTAAVFMRREDLAAMAARAVSLRASGADLITLACAIEVIANRAAAAASEDQPLKDAS